MLFSSRPISQPLVLGSTNLHKLREIREILNPHGIQIESIEKFVENFDVEEVAKDFKGNAWLKAKACFKKTSYTSLADDSGLVVDALGGRPGIYSARYGAPFLTDRERCLLLLKEMEKIPREKRRARFVCCLALAFSEKIEEARFFEARTEGYILNTYKEKNGFGYDPIFEGLEIGKSFAEATAEEKNKVSHRGKAMKQFIDFLSNAMKI